MEAELNTSAITLSGYEAVEQHRLLFTVLVFVLYVLILGSNSIIVYLIWVQQNLHEPMYIFIAALLVNSVLFSSSIYPKLLLDSMTGNRLISYGACLAQVFVFSSLGASEFYLLAVMACDRYASICRPLQYPALMRRTTVRVLLALSWSLPPVQLAAGTVLYLPGDLCHFTMIGFFCSSSILDLLCVMPSGAFLHDVSCLLIIGVIPVTFIVFSYSRILLISYSSREARRKAAQTCLPHLSVLATFSCLSAFDVVVPRIQLDFPPSVRLVMTTQVVVYSPLFNPIIYGLKMKKIHKHLKRFFCQDKLK